jgi:hypothetical protein
MIDEAFDTELEARLRASLDEMIPKLLASAPVTAEPGAQGEGDIMVARRAAWSVQFSRSQPRSSVSS